MKKGFLIAISIVCAVVICSSVVLNSSKPVKAEEISVATVVSGSEDLKADLLSMLNHNFVYGADFDDAGVIANRSLNALLALKENGDDYIEESFVIDFVKNMYGIEIVDFSGFDAKENNKSGYIFTGNCGDVTYNHENISLKYNEDGTISAQTDVTVTENDGITHKLSANSLFVPNENSAFGYNIIYSEIENGGISA